MTVSFHGGFYLEICVHNKKFELQTPFASPLSNLLWNHRLGYVVLERGKPRRDFGTAGICSTVLENEENIELSMGEGWYLEFYFLISLGHF